jgi:hypothetical protein
VETWEVRERLEAYAEARERERYRLHAGIAPDAELAEVAERFQEVTTGEPLDGLRAERENAAFESERDALGRLIRLLEDAVLAARAFALERARRGARGDELEERLLEDFAVLGGVRAKLGHANGRARFESALPGVDVDAWARKADQLLERTEGAYRDLLLPALARAGVAPDEARAPDVLAAASASALDALFPFERMIECLAFTSGGMGLYPDAVSGIAFDCEARPSRGVVPRAFALRVPGEIVISHAPAAGVAAHRGLFAAFGAALPAAFSSAELPVERRRGGDPALARGFGLLLANRLGDPHWIDSSPAGQRSEELAQEAALFRLLRLRGSAARLQLELELARVAGGEAPGQLGERYAEELSRAFGAPVRREGWLLRCDPELEALHALRAWCFAEQLAELLRERFGRAFWRERRAGELLKELWHTGSSYDADGLAAELGCGPLDPEHLLAAGVG